MPGLVFLKRIDPYGALASGARIAPIFPIYGLIAWAMGDFEGLRNFISSAGNQEMTQTVTLLVMVGFFIGVLFHSALSVGITRSDDPVKAEHPSDAQRWYWSLPAEGAELAVREATTLRSSPHIDTRWELLDMARELARPEVAGGSDLLDHRILKLLDISSGLKPTQDEVDAVRLLELRYGSLNSALEWRIETEKRLSGYRAYIAVRTPGDANAEVPPEWQQCLVGDGASPALAVTAAAIVRETWTFRS